MFINILFFIVCGLFAVYAIEFCQEVLTMVIACTFLYYDSNNIQHSYNKKTTLYNLRNVLEKNIIDMLTNIDGY